jgi:cyclic pyranopterin phosphate synthase
MRDARFIPLHPAPGPGPSVLPLPPASDATSRTSELVDALGRPLRDLRISVTDRCNFRCGYCMPRSTYGPGYRFLPHDALLSFEEIERSSRLFVSLGVRKLRLTGGEPLMRKQLDRLVAALSTLRTPQGGAVELALTTNASLLAAKAQALKEAGLNRITISLDALDGQIFQRMNDAGVPVGTVLAGIEAAQRAGLGPIKVNMVVQKGINDAQILPMARHFRNTGIELRFIEYMDVGATNGWQLDQVLPSNDVRSRIAEHFALTPVPEGTSGETAQRYRYADGAGTVGFISSVTQAFCGDCNRLRLSTDGRLYTCLFARQGHDLRSALRSAQSDEAIAQQLGALWQGRRDQYSVQRAHGTLARPPSEHAGRIEMSYIGG